MLQKECKLNLRFVLLMLLHLELQKLLQWKLLLPIQFFLIKEFILPQLQLQKLKTNMDKSSKNLVQHNKKYLVLKQHT